MLSKSVDSDLTHLVPNFNENVFNISLLCIMCDIVCFCFFLTVFFDSPGVWMIPWAQQRDQISGALKTRDNAPKYGLIFHSTLIGRAAAKNKDSISQYLANKCSIASRIYCFSKVPTSVLGEKLWDQAFLWD